VLLAPAAGVNSGLLLGEEEPGSAGAGSSRQVPLMAEAKSMTELEPLLADEDAGGCE
jgi:hypothetical protein